MLQPLTQASTETPSQKGLWRPMAGRLQDWNFLCSTVTLCCRVRMSRVVKAITERRLRGVRKKQHDVKTEKE